jgi:predicted metal-dependent enzyme (double-stranded beta helix superfamily)
MSETLISDHAAQRAEAVARIVEETRRIEAEAGITRDSLDRIKATLIRLASQELLFPDADFPPPRRGEHKDIAFYRLAQEPDGRRALYVSVALAGKESPPHDHGNWAVLAGVRGVEVHRLYDRVETADGVTVRERERIAVGPGSAVALLPEDIHSIHVQGEGDARVVQLRYYERGLELQTERSAFTPGEAGAVTFPPNLNITLLGPDTGGTP